MRIIVIVRRANLAVLLALLALIAAAPASHAQISGTYTYDSGNHAYFVQGNTAVDGDISGNDVFVGKDNATSFTTIPSGITLNVNAGATITTISGNPNNPYPDGLIYRGLNLFGANQANISGGSVTLARGYSTTSLNITNGSVFEAESHDYSKTSISGGNLNCTDGKQSLSDLRSILGLSWSYPTSREPQNVPRLFFREPDAKAAPPWPALL